MIIIFVGFSISTLLFNLLYLIINSYLNYSYGMFLFQHVQLLAQTYVQSVPISYPDLEHTANTSKHLLVRLSKYETKMSPVFVLKLFCEQSTMYSM